VMTFAMSAGARRMRHQQVIVKRLSAIFNLGEVNVLCTDKTGTLTEGSIRVHAIVNLAGPVIRQERAIGAAGPPAPDKGPPARFRTPFFLLSYCFLSALLQLQGCKARSARG
jgi:magnesium-transporting ATPase (P-type)